MILQLSGFDASPHASFSVHFGISLPEEIWLNIFGHLNGVDLAKAKLACQDWKRIGNDDSLAFKIAEEIAKKNVEKIRPILDHCACCSEGYRGGYYVVPLLNTKGEIVGLDGHDVDTHWLEANRKDAKKGLYSIELRMHAADWKPTKEQAFSSLNRGYYYEKEYIDSLPKHLELVECYMINELNKTARKALAMARKHSIKHDLKLQPWFVVMLNNQQYKTSDLLAMV